MKKTILTCATAGILMATPVIAEVTGNAAVSSNYIWRGFTQTVNDIAVSGGLDYSNDSGVYAGIWASNVDFRSDADVEVDVYGGITGDFNDDISWDIGLLTYNYPGAKGRFDEVYAGVGYGVFSFTYFVGVDIRADEVGNYAQIGADFEIGELGLSLHAGNYDYDSGADITDYKIAVSKDISGYGVEFAISDSDAVKTKTDFTLTVSTGF